MRITVLNSDFESVWSLIANFTSKVLGSKLLFSEFRSKIETLIFRKVAKSTSKDRWQTNVFYTQYLQFLGILMAIDGKAEIGLQKFRPWQKMKDFGVFLECSVTLRKSKQTTFIRICLDTDLFEEKWINYVNALEKVKQNL